MEDSYALAFFSFEDLIFIKSFGFHFYNCFVDASYEDPVGPQPERPKTGLKRRDHDEGVDFDDEVIGDDLLPE